MDPQIFIDITLDELASKVEDYYTSGWRFCNICGSATDDGVELLYTFSKKEELENLRLVLPDGSKVPSISEKYFNAFVFENETHDLYGIEFTDMAIDFGGNFYVTSTEYPMNPRYGTSVTIHEKGKGNADTDNGSDMPAQVGEANE
jgi:hypothetical protein